MAMETPVGLVLHDTKLDQLATQAFAAALLTMNPSNFTALSAGRPGSSWEPPCDTWGYNQENRYPCYVLLYNGIYW